MLARVMALHPSGNSTSRANAAQRREQVRAIRGEGVVPEREEDRTGPAVVRVQLGHHPLGRAVAEPAPRDVVRAEGAACRAAAAREHPAGDDLPWGRRVPPRVVERLRELGERERVEVGDEAARRSRAHRTVGCAVVDAGDTVERTPRAHVLHQLDDRLLGFTDHGDVEAARQGLVGAHGRMRPARDQDRRSAAQPGTEIVDQPVGVPDPACEQADPDDVRRKTVNRLRDGVCTTTEVPRRRVDDPHLDARRQERRGHVLLAEQRRTQRLGRGRVDE